MSLEERVAVARNDRAIIKLFAPQLSKRLGRKIDGDNDCLTCMDFPYPEEVVELDFEDESKMKFEYAFIVEGDECYGVFTEHAGYHCIYKASIVGAKILFPGDRRRKPKYLKREQES